MKNPLHYQLCEYDCGPTSILNGVSYLFEREAIPPVIIKQINHRCMDCCDANGECGKLGTSCEALKFLSTWLDRFGERGELNISSKFIGGRCVSLKEDRLLIQTLSAGGVAVVHVYLDQIGHYVLLTGAEDRKVRMFDPYFRMAPFSDTRIQIVHDHPFEYNRIIPFEVLECPKYEDYAMGPYETREAVLMLNVAKCSDTSVQQEMLSGVV